MNLSSQPTVKATLLKTTVVHTLSYFLMGILALNLFNYAEAFNQPPLNTYMRPTVDPIVMLGVVFQPIRGLLFGIVFYLFREIIFTHRNGWLKAWVMLVLVGIFSTFGPAPGSIEGMIYTKLTLGQHLGGGILEVLLQAFLLAYGTVYWISHPQKKWLNWIFGVGFFVVLLLPILGLFAQSIAP